MGKRVPDPSDVDCIEVTQLGWICALYNLLECSDSLHGRESRFVVRNELLPISHAEFSNVPRSPLLFLEK